MKEKKHPSTDINPIHHVWNDRYRRSHGPLRVASFVEVPSRVNELTPDTVLQSTSGKELNSTKNAPLATSQCDASKSEPDSKSKDGSLDPPLDRGDETDPKENPHENS